MKKLLKEIWKEPEFWIFIVFFGVISLGCMMVAIMAQRADISRRFEESNRRAVLEMKNEIETLRLQNEKSIKDWISLRKSVADVKKDVDKVKENQE